MHYPLTAGFSRFSTAGEAMCLDCDPPAADNPPASGPAGPAAQPRPARKWSRRAMLGAAGAAGGMAAGLSGTGWPASASTSAAGQAVATGNRSRPAARLRWLGIAGWDLSFGGRRLLIDPYLSRTEYRSASGAVDPQAPLTVNRRIIERVVRTHLPEPPELVLTTHGHWDHLGDVPYLLTRPGDPGTARDWSAARIRTIGTETSRHLLTAMGIPASRRPDVLVAT